MNSDDWLVLERKVRFGDCDSAGVLHFHNLLRWAHEAWEESVENYGISLCKIFPFSESKLKIALPIINCEARFFCPIKLGDHLKMEIMPKKINDNLFKVEIFFFKEKIKCAQSTVIHCSIDSNSRKKKLIPEELQLWIEASNLNNKISQC